MLPHDLAVKVKARLRVLHERAIVDQLREILLPLGINFRRVQVDARCQINLRLADMQETQGIARRHLPRFLGRHHVVG